MKHFKLLTTIALSLILCVGTLMFTIGSSASDGKMWFQSTEKTDAYVFPEYEGDESMEWNEILEFLQVPEDVIKNMSTDGIIETCLTYPIYSIGMITSNVSMYAGFQKTCENFNGLKELFNREDVSEKLLTFYQHIDYGKVVRTSDSYALRMRYIEHIISQEEILTKLSIEERSRFKSICVKNVVERFQEYSEQLPIDSALLIIARISYLDDPAFSNYAKERRNIQSFLNEGMLQSFTEEEFTELRTALNIQWEVS